MRKAHGNETVDVTLLVMHETDKAWLVSDTGDPKTEVWLPKSQCEKGPRKGGSTFEFTMPEWLAVEKGFF